MSDIGNIYGCYDEGEMYLKKLMPAKAAEAFWRCEQYFEHGELYGGFDVAS